MPAPRSLSFGSKPHAAEEQCLASAGCVNDEPISSWELLLFSWQFCCLSIFLVLCNDQLFYRAVATHIRSLSVCTVSTSSLRSSGPTTCPSIVSPELGQFAQLSSFPSTPIMHFAGRFMYSFTHLASNYG